MADGVDIDLYADDLDQGFAIKVSFSSCSVLLFFKYAFNDLKAILLKLYLVKCFFFLFDLRRSLMMMLICMTM